MDNPSAPLTEDHYQQMVTALRMLDTMQPQLDRAKQAGVDVSVAQKDADAARAKILQMKNVYFPGR